MVAFLFWQRVARRDHAARALQLARGARTGVISGRATRRARTGGQEAVLFAPGAGDRARARTGALGEEFAPTPPLPMLYNGVGLQTPRGSGTSGYVQRNAAAVKDEQVRDKAGGGLYRSRQLRQAPPRARATSAALLEHERKRLAALRVAELRDRLEDEGVSEEEIEQQVAKLRADAGAARERSPERPAYEPRYLERARRPEN